MARIGCAQMTSGASVEENLAQIESLTQEAKAQKASMVVLPEECLTLGLTDTEKVAFSKKSSIWQEKLSDVARRFKLWLVAGSVPVQADENHYFSTTLVFDEFGELRHTYQKIHLFDVSVAQGIDYQESKTVQPGSTPVVFDSPVGRIGLSICYDVRFPEFYRKLVEQEAQVLLVPSAFTPQTGSVHWKTLLCARAIENLCYVVAPNQNGLRANSEGTYGHSLIVGPWGDVLACADSGATCLVTEIDLDTLSTCRHRFPVLSHRRF